MASFFRSCHKRCERASTTLGNPRWRAPIGPRRGLVFSNQGHFPPPPKTARGPPNFFRPPRTLPKTFGFLLDLQGPHARPLTRLPWPSPKVPPAGIASPTSPFLAGTFGLPGKTASHGHFPGAGELWAKKGGARLWETGALFGPVGPAVAEGSKTSTRFFG